MSFTVLSVCTGNICRSPLSERLIAARAGHRGLISVSAGTHGLAGHPMDAPSAAVLRELGGDPEGHAARRLTAADVQAADLVLTATTEHRDAAVRLVPSAADRIFTLREFGRLAAGLPAPAPDDQAPDSQALRQRVRQIAERRATAEPPAPGADDIGDPFGAPDAETRRVGFEVSAAVDRVLAALLLGDPSDASGT